MTSVFPVLPLRDVVVFPQMVVPLFVGREKSINALEAAMAEDKQVVLLAQKEPETDDPGADALFNVGTQANLLQLLRLPDGTVKVLVEGEQRVIVESISTSEGEFLSAQCRVIAEKNADDESSQAVSEQLVDKFELYVKGSKKVPSEVFSTVSGIENFTRLVDTIATHVNLEVSQKQELLEIESADARAVKLMGYIDSEMDVFKVDKKIRGRVKKQMEKSQREYYLNEQMKAIQKELGELDEGANEFEELETKIQECGMPEEAKKKASSEMSKLKMMSPMSAEASVVRSYIDWMVGIPWKKKSKVRLDLDRAQKILDADHYGLEEVKERIVEYLAVQRRVKKLKGPVLCLVGPPGVGKTSLGESMARATNRKFIRMALGGVRDEAEIRGHRRTYIGSMPGKILQKLSKVGVKNPLFLLDEIDKMGMDHRGDPASALLEVLDPEQNHTFNDHYLEVDYDLSDVMFVCTSNSMNIPAPLHDRMEIIRIPGYTEDEKANIANNYLKPKQFKANGVKKGEIELEDSAVRSIIRHYTREAGVRSLDRQVAKVVRKAITGVTKGDLEAPVIVDDKNLEDFCGVEKFKHGEATGDNRVGQVTGLAWTQVGGELLSIEVATMNGKGRQVKTGSLGDVMQESILAATTVVRSRAQVLGIPSDFNDKYDYHFHVPEGATPKDGPSAGIGMCTALISSLTKIPVKSTVAMTGEITLRGEVLPIGGLKEKLLAAHRGGIREVIIPAENERDLKEIPDNIKDALEIRPVEWIDQVLEIALERMPDPLSDEEYFAENASISDSVDKNKRPNTH